MGEADYSKPGGHILEKLTTLSREGIFLNCWLCIVGEADYSKPGGHILDALLDICDMPAGAWAGGGATR